MISECPLLAAMWRAVSPQTILLVYQHQPGVNELKEKLQTLHVSGMAEAVERCVARPVDGVNWDFVPDAFFEKFNVASPQIIRSYYYCSFVANVCGLNNDPDLLPARVVERGQSLCFSQIQMVWRHITFFASQTRLPPVLVCHFNYVQEISGVETQLRRICCLVIVQGGRKDEVGRFRWRRRFGQHIILLERSKSIASQLWYMICDSFLCSVCFADKSDAKGAVTLKTSIKDAKCLGSKVFLKLYVPTLVNFLTFFFNADRQPLNVKAFLGTMPGTICW